MAKIRKNEVNTFGLPKSIRSRIDELVNLNLNPTTVNLLTYEFSNFDEEIRSNIGKYIEGLLIIENELLENHLNLLKEKNIFGNNKQEFVLKQRKNNLLRIQQLFNNEKNKTYNNRKNSATEEKTNSLLNNDFKKIMVTNQDNKTPEQREKEKFRELANKKRMLEVVIDEENKKIKLAKQNYLKAKKENDIALQQKNMNLINEANNKLVKIDDAIKTYKTVESLPLDLLLADDLTIDIERDEKNVRDYLKEKNNVALKKLQKDMIRFNQNKINKNTTNKKTNEPYVDNFFTVEGFDDDYESDSQNIFSEDGINFTSKYNAIMEEIESDTVKKKATNKKINNIFNTLESTVNKKEKSLDKLNKEKEKLLEELNFLKEQNKIEKEKRILKDRERLKKETDYIIFRDKYKVSLAYKHLEKKWKTFNMKKNLATKHLFLKAIKNLKHKNNNLKNTEYLANDDLVETPLMDELTFEEKITQARNVFEFEKEETNKNNYKFDNLKLLINKAYNLQIQKRVSYLERKKVLNTITKKEKVELEEYKRHSNQGLLNKKYNSKKIKVKMYLKK